MTDLILPKESYNGMSREDFDKAVVLMMLSLDQMDNRQRWLFRQIIKNYTKQIRARYPKGRPFAEIKNEIAVEMSKEIIKPQ